MAENAKHQVVYATCVQLKSRYSAVNPLNEAPRPFVVPMISSCEAVPSNSSHLPNLIQLKFEIESSIPAKALLRYAHCTSLAARYPGISERI